MMLAAHSHLLPAAALLLLAWLLDRRAARPRGPRLHVAALPAWAVQLVVYVVTTLISRALAPKPKPTEPGKPEIPDVKEGKAPVEIYGAVWIKEPFMAGWKAIDPPEPIKANGGEK